MRNCWISLIVWYDRTSRNSERFYPARRQQFTSHLKPFVGGYADGDNGLCRFFLRGERGWYCCQWLAERFVLKSAGVTTPAPPPQDYDGQ